MANRFLDVEESQVRFLVGPFFLKNITFSSYLIMKRVILLIIKNNCGKGEHEEPLEQTNQGNRAEGEAV